MTTTTPRTWVLAWALGGNLLLLLDAAVRMARAGWTHAEHAQWSVAQGVVATLLAVGFAWGEGHHALARRFVPMLRERARSLASCSGPRGCLPLVFAPLVAAGLLWAPRARLLRSWGLVLGIVAMVIAMRALPAGLRAGIDLGVALALAWGALALVRAELPAAAMTSSRAR
ncbi:MAG: hypothetical protein K1X88_03970 [Nannocystaceae bacterium]|nr:hypothetical protein [Nannocystaceae bacterium]